MITKLIDNFAGRLTRDNIGDMNSGLTKYPTTFGNDPFSNIGNLTWLESPVSILSTDNSVGPVVAMRQRTESNVDYVYAITTSAKLYKIQVNDPVSKNPNYDAPTVLTTLTAQLPTLFLGGSIQFYGSTEKLFIGHDTGITKINFDGTGETFVGNLGSYSANVPRPSASFLGKIYFGNGANITEIDSSETVTSYNKLSPGFPVGTYVRDLDVSPDGNYLQITVSRLKPSQLDGLSIDTSSLSSVDSYKFLWNGTDAGYTSYESFNGYALTGNTVFGAYNYTVGYDLGGAALYSSGKKIFTLTNSISPNFAAMFSAGNLVGFAAPEYDTSANKFKGSIYFYGQYDQETPIGLFRFLRQTAVQGNDVILMQSCIPVSNLFYVPPFYGYTGNVGGVSKLYFSTTEVVSSGGLTVYNTLFRFCPVPTGSGTAIGGVYETQNETSVKLFRNILKKKLKTGEIRVYLPSFNNVNQSFKVEVIGNDGNPVSGGTQIFTATTTNTDIVKYTTQIAPQHSIGLRITNLGTKNFVIEKVEVDMDEFGT